LMRNFLIGAIVGGGLMFCSLTYHLLRADDGFHLVVKLEHIWNCSSEF